MAEFFDKNQRKSCVWCAFGIKSDYSDDIFCEKRGVVGSDSVCKKYKYDPLKRTPAKNTLSGDFSEDDFSL